MALQRTGVIVVRVWLDEPTGAFRARVTESIDLERDGQRTSAVATPDGAIELVRSFLEAFAREEGDSFGER